MIKRSGSATSQLTRTVAFLAAAWGAVALAVLVTPACGSGGGAPPLRENEAATGGVGGGTGGTATGGTATGGTREGDAEEGGAGGEDATGGRANGTGGTATGGQATGGTATGGRATGGSATGGTGTGGSPSTPGVSSLSGTWSGTLSSATESKQWTINLSNAGNFILSYTRQGGQVVMVELTAAGQNFAALLSTGEVMRVTVDLVTRGSNRLTAAWHYSLESTSSASGNVYQDLGAVQWDLMLDGTGLRTILRSQSASYVNGVQTTGDETTMTGVLLRKV